MPANRMISVLEEATPDEVAAQIRLQLRVAELLEASDIAIDGDTALALIGLGGMLLRGAALLGEADVSLVCETLREILTSPEAYGL